MKTALRWLLTIVGTIIALVVLGTVAPRPLFSSAQSGEGQARRILVFSSPIHTDIAVPIEALGDEFAFLREAGLPLDHPDARWVLFGWGGRSFYVATPQLTDIQLGPLLKSFGLDSSAMHVEVIGVVDEPQPHLAAFSVSDEGLDRLLGFIRRSFAEKGGGPVRIEGAGYGPNDAFYEGVGSFNAFLGCNTWTAAALREGGLRTGWWNPLPVTLGYSLEMYN
jgi:uncharacterized protein (TIGR02117 family)